MLLAIESSLDMVGPTGWFGYTESDSFGAYPRCLSIMVAERIIAAGLALFVPIISLATCRQPGSKRAYS